MEYKKKLIEVALPLEAINEASAREKSIRHGHPSTLHLWWARRPLAAARAVIFSSLVDDPSAHPELFPTEEAQEKERQRLFDLIEKLVAWANSNNETILNAAKTEIWKSTDGNPPALLDPFAGGGAIPLEAQRLGLEAHASDLNPVAVMINKAMIEIPPKFAGNSPVNPESRSILNQDKWIGASGLAEDVKYYGAWMKQEALKRIGHLYPKVRVPDEQGEEATVIAWIWARTVKCPNPACGCEMPLLKSYVICQKAESEVYIDTVIQKNKTITYHVKNGVTSQEVGTVNRKGAKCICCGSPVSFSYIREESKNNRMFAQLVAIVAEGRKGRVYLSPDKKQIDTANVALPSNCDFGELAYYPGYINPYAYGLTEIQSLFTNRQLTTLLEFSKLCYDLQEKVRKDAIDAGLIDDEIELSDGGQGAKAYGEAVTVYLALAVDKLADYNSSICSWHSSKELIRNTFGLTGMSMSWDYAEANPFSNSSGCFDNAVDWIKKCILTFQVSKQGVVQQFDAQSDIGLRDIMVSTDPPYYSNVPYADFSDFFYVLLRRCIKNIYPLLFRTLLTPKNEELVADPYRVGSKEKAAEHFESGMLEACKKMYLYCSNDIPLTIFYSFKQSEEEKSNDSVFASSTGWEKMLSAIIMAGFTITGTWPIRTEMATRSRAKDSNALASSIVLVCRKRLNEALVCTRREFINSLKRELKPALNKLQVSNIAPVDLAQSAIGPGMAVYSRYSQVIESDGSPMSIRSALQIINQELDHYFSEQEGTLDQNSRFCVGLYSQFAFNDLKFGEADVLARAKNTSVDRLVSERALFAQKGVVHLLTREEIGLSGNHKNHFIWLITQQLTYAMETGGITACAQIISMIMDSSAENAKNLAYRLFTIAERKKWAEEAYAYNSLVIAWPDIIAKVTDLKSTRPEQMSLEEFHI
jgi:putative DNA methylase